MMKRIVRLLLVTAALSVTSAPAHACDATATAIVAGYLEWRDAGSFVRAQRYLTEDFAATFHARTGAAYADYVGGGGRSWRGSQIVTATPSGPACVVSVSATRESDAGTSTVAEVFTVILTPRGWRIERWDWQPAD